VWYVFGVLYGRERELGRLEEALREAREGASSVLVVRGPAGIGKSAVLRRARERAAGMRVLEARGVEAESELPFSGLMELLGPVVGLTSELPPPQAAAVRGALALEPAAGIDRFAVCVGTLALLAAAADQTPLLVLVEDLHWLDSASGEALAFAARRLRAEPILLLVSCRDEPTTVSEAGGFEVLTLGGLGADAAAGLLVERVGRPVASGVVERLVAATGGNPLALLELAGVLTAAQLGGELPLPDPLPAHISAQRLFGHRIAALDPEGRRALLLAAAAGEGEARQLLAAATAESLDPAVFERVEASGLLLFSDGRLRFCHPLVRSAVYAAAGPAERRAAHGALADVFADDRRAWHLAAAAFGADEQAASALEQAAERARARGGFAAAAAALGRAAALSVGASERARRLLGAADAARLAGRPEHAFQLLDEADELLPDDRLVLARNLAARARIERAAGRVHDAWQHYAHAADLLGDRDPRRAAAARAHSALAALIAGHFQDAVQMAARARASLDDDSGEAETLIAALILGAALYRSGSMSEGLALLSPAAELADRPDRSEPDLAAFAAFMLVVVDEHRRAEAILEPLIREARAASALGVLPFALFASSFVDVRCGRWTPAYASASEAAELANETGSGLWRCLALSTLVQVEAGRGSEQACREHAREAEQLADGLGIENIRDIDDALGMLELSLGRSERAIEKLERIAAAPGDQQGVHLRQSTPELVEAYARTRNPRANRLAQLATEQTERISIPSLSALAARCRGLVAPDDRFDRDFEDALRLFYAAEWPFQAGRTALNYGERLRRAGRRLDARAQLHTALEIFNRLGAQVWAEQAESELRATGERLRRRDPTAAEQLTAQELQIALAVARGATNREAAAALFLSHKTIERHLSHIYRKLGVRSRTELASLFSADAGGTSRHDPVAARTHNTT